MSVFYLQKNDIPGEKSKKIVFRNSAFDQKVLYVKEIVSTKFKDCPTHQKQCSKHAVKQLKMCSAAKNRQKQMKTTNILIKLLIPNP